VTSWSEEELRARNAEELEGETAEEAAELDLDDLPDEEVAEIPVAPPPPEEEESEW